MVVRRVDDRSPPPYGLEDPRVPTDTPELALRPLLLLALLALPAAATPPPGLTEVLREGDIVLQRSQSDQSAAIAAATGSPWTHVGLVFRRSGEWVVLEAVQPVRYTPLASWARRGHQGQVIAMRSRAPIDVERLRVAGERFLGRPYDMLFQWGDDRIYCSELVTKAFAEQGVEVGRRVPLGELDLTAPSVQALLRARAPAGADLREELVPPSSYLDDPGLEKVFGEP